MTIRCIYRDVAPDFPATDQHPDAARFGPIIVDGATYFVDAIGAAPTAEDIRAVLSPAAPFPRIISDRQFFQQLAIQGLITQDESLAAVGPGTIPAALAQLVAALPVDKPYDARILLIGATQFDRQHPMVAAIAAAFGWTNAQTDDLWRAAATL